MDFQVLYLQLVYTIREINILVVRGASCSCERAHQILRPFSSL